MYICTILDFYIMNIQKWIFLIVLSISLIQSLSAQDNQERTIEVKVTKDLKKVYVHTLQPKETLYSLARTFDLPLVYLAKINSIEKDATLAVGSELIIPIKDDLIKDVKSSPNDVPLVYKTKPKETIFRISRIYFDQQIEDIQRINGLTDLKLDVDQILQIGWINVAMELPKKKQYEFEDYVLVDTVFVEKKDSITAASTSEEKTDSSEVIIVLDPHYKRGIAFWNKTGNANDLFVLHDEAKPQTEIELYNPLVNKKVIATVVASLPSNTYPEDINLVISAGVARQLGAIDSRFAVEMKYYK